MKSVADNTFNSVILREIMSTDVPQLWYEMHNMLYDEASTRRASSCGKFSDISPLFAGGFFMRVLFFLPFLST
jgi:hypothetical protein